MLSTSAISEDFGRMPDVNYICALTTITLVHVDGLYPGRVLATRSGTLILLRDLWLVLLAEGLFGPVAGAVQFQDRAVVDDPVDGCGSGHGVFENLVPLREDEIGGDEHALSLVPLCQKGEEHLHLFLLLLHVPDVIDDDRFKAIQAAHFPFQGKVPFCYEQSLDQTIRRSKAYGSTSLHQLVADSRNEMGLPSSRQTECQDILGSLQEMSFAQRR